MNVLSNIKNYELRIYIPASIYYLAEPRKEQEITSFQKIMIKQSKRVAYNKNFYFQEHYFISTIISSRLSSVVIIWYLQSSAII